MAPVGVRVGVVGEERVEQVEELATVAEAGQLVGDRLAVALLGDGLQAPDREGEPDPDRDQRRGCQRQGDLVHLPDCVEEEDAKAGGGAEAGQQKPRRFVRCEQVGAAGAQPDRHRDQQQRHRPGDGIDDRAGPRRTHRRLEQVEGVAGGVDGARRGEQEPLGPGPAREDRRATDDQREQQHVADRVGQVRRHGKGIAADRVQDGVEREGRADGRGAEAGDEPVEPRPGEQPLDVPAQQQHHRHVGQREEPEEEDIGQRGRGRRRSAQRLDGVEQVAGRPPHHPGTEDQWDPAPRPAAEAAGQAHHAGEEFEGVDQPAVDQGPGLAVAAEQQGRRVGGDEEAHHAVRSPQQCRGTGAPACRRLASNPKRRRGHASSLGAIDVVSGHEPATRPP